jgi:hypothetical protein
MERPPLVVNKDGKKLRAQPLASGAGRSGSGSPQTPKHKIQFAMAAVYPGTIWRQGFATFSIWSNHQPFLSNR